MKRKPLYVLLATPVIALVVYLAIVPSETRVTFLTEFKYRIAALFGYEPEPIGEELGLRSEHPEEYGPQATGEEATPAAADGANGADADGANAADASEPAESPGTPADLGDTLPDESSGDAASTTEQPGE